MFENPQVLVNSHPEIDEDGEAISSTPLETISSTPWEYVAVDVWPILFSAFEIVRNLLESNDELDEVESNPINEMTKNILCIDKNLDLRVALHTKRILTSLSDDEMHSIGNIINSAIIDPEVKGGLRWPYGKACSGDRFAVVGIWHTIAKKYKSPSLSLMARHVDRFDFKKAIGEASIEVYLKE
ncbi:hypothetical protein LWI28_016690 [Acer negundo]|uniref:DUF7903 domain-containing protein n=1 Tax=Acer negundo TaxID=4023 RepID=A0AAD5J9W6_ACENE|nr:hypothetical protein LWI28_016690 [Acer negundo]